MTFRVPGRWPEPTDEIRALVSLVKGIDVMSTGPITVTGEPTRWQVSGDDGQIFANLDIDATFEEWQELLQKIVSGNYKLSI